MSPDAELAVPELTEPGHRVAVVTMGCARNDVDSDELAGRLTSGGFALVAEPADADVVVVNTCGFIDAAKKDSIDAVLAAADLRDSGRPSRVVAVGCLAERYGSELADSLPEADAVLGFDDYGQIATRLRQVLNGESLVAPTPADRRVLPLVEAKAPTRRLLAPAPTANLKIASGCDRRCSFCAIPRFRGSFISRPAADVLAEASWLAEQGVVEVFCVSENTTAYGKDRGEPQALAQLLPQLAALVPRVRVSYLQPAELRPQVVESIAATPGVAPYFDLSFQHASPSILRRMRRFGGSDSFLKLLGQIRNLAPTAGIRSNVIVGFPGETEADLNELAEFLAEARLDVVGVFGYSDEEDTEAVTLDGHIDESEIAERVERISSLVGVLMDDRAAERIGERVSVLVEAAGPDQATGRALHQGPEVDGVCLLPPGPRVGDVVEGVVSANVGIDLMVQVDA